MYYVLGTLNYNSGKYRLQDEKKRVFLITVHILFPNFSSTCLQGLSLLQVVQLFHNIVDLFLKLLYGGIFGWIWIQTALSRSQRWHKNLNIAI